MFAAGSMVKGGFYFNRDKWDLVAVSGQTGLLPGVEGERYRRVPAWAVLLLAPLLGALFVIFMPFVGFVLVAQYAARRLVKALRRTEQTVDGTPASRSV